MRRPSVSFGLVLITLLSPILLNGQTHTGEVFPSSLVAKNEKAYQVKIERVAQTAIEEKMLQTAEGTYPESSDIEKACPSRSKSNRPLQTPDMPRWWCGSFDGIFIPYAVTKEAVAYYLAVTDEFRKDDFERSGKLKMKSTSLRYSASVNMRTSYTNGEKVFSNVYEVTMTLSWNQFCGSLCAMAFSNKRTVIIDGDGKVLLALGDEQPWTVVS